jgi:uncharacterized membrane protein YgcG
MFKAPKTPKTKRLNPKYDETMSNFAFKFNVRRYTLVEVEKAAAKTKATTAAEAVAVEVAAAVVAVGRCRLTASKPVLKALMVSALETKRCCTAFKRCFQFQRAPLHRGEEAGDGLRRVGAGEGGGEGGGGGGGGGGRA